MNIMHIDGESSDEDESFDEDDEASDEDDESSIEERLYRFEKMVRQVEENDPSLLSIDIGFGEGTLFYNVDWERFGAIIEINTHMKEITVELRFLERQKIVVHFFFRGLGLNRSIERLSLKHYDDETEEMFLLLLPFFQNNESIEYLDVSFEVTVEGEAFGNSRSLAFAPGLFSSLKEFRLRTNDANITNITDTACIIEALAGHIGMRNVCFLDFPIWREGIVALAALLCNLISNITVLSLYEVLARGLSGHETLRELNLSFNRRITEPGWQAIFAALQQPIFRLEKLYLCGNNISALSLSVSDILNHNTTLQVLILNYTTFERNTVWGGLLTWLLLSPNCTLECLQLGSTNLDDFNLQLLANVLAHNGSLKRLGHCSNPAVTPAMWMAFATYL